MNVYETFYEVMTQSNKSYDQLVENLRDAVISARNAGESKEAILEEFKRLYDVMDETQQDMIADVADFLYGYCSPHMKID